MIFGPITFFAAIVCLAVGSYIVYQRLNSIEQKLDQGDRIGQQNILSFGIIYLLILFASAACYLIAFVVFGHRLFPHLFF